MVDWGFNPIYGSVLIVVVLAALLMVTITFFKEQRELNYRQRVTLLVLRCIAVFLLLMMLLRPQITFRSNTNPRGAIAVMADVSSSMNLPSQVSGRSRFQLQQMLIDRLDATKSKFGADNPIVLYNYSADAAVGDAVQSVADQEGTDVGLSLATILAEQTSPPLSSVVWLGDAIQTIEPATADPQRVATQLARIDVPLLMIGLGPDSSNNDFRDIAIESVPEQLEVFSKNRVKLSGLLNCRGALNRELATQLFLRDAEGTESLVGEATVRPTQISQVLPFQMTIIAPESGAYELIVRVPAIEKEASTENNETICFLNVSDGGARVLLIDGQAREEQQFIRRGLAESPDLELDFIWVKSQPNSRKQQDITDVLAAGVHDAYILGDVHSQALTPRSWQELANRVRDGAGLITLGGFHSYGAGGFSRNNPLVNVVPVDMELNRIQRFDQNKIDTSLHYDRDIKLTPTADHPIVNFGTPSETKERWDEVPALKGANRWAGVRQIPGVSVLARDDQDLPMIVKGDYFRGRVLCFAFDTSFRWWRQGYGDFHRQFWRQSTLWAMRTASREEELKLSMTKRRLLRGQDSNLTIEYIPGIGDSDDENSSLSNGVDAKSVGQVPQKIDVTLTAPDGSETSAVAVQVDPVKWQLSIDAPEKAGRYRVSASAAGNRKGELESELPFLVIDESLELIQPIPDWQLMEQMAQLNAEAGGKLYGPEEIDALIEDLLKRKNTAALETVETYRLGDTTIDSWGFFLAFAGTMIAIWWTRKRYNLA